MPSRTFFSALLALAFTACTTQQPVVKAPEPPPLSTAEELLSQQAVDAVIYQNTSAEVHRLFQQSFELAHLKLDANLDREWPKPPAVIVDVDETILDNSPYEVDVVSKGEVYAPDSWKAWTDRASATALPGALEFLEHAVAHGCAVFYVTNRNADETQSTINNLKTLGFPMANEKHVLTRTTSSDKTERRALVAETHSIVLLAGDQLRDFDEVFNDRAINYGKDHVDAMRDTLSNYFILLPNPMYGTWRDAVSGKKGEEKLDRIDTFFKDNALD